jgi:hypothetical protein
MAVFYKYVERQASDQIDWGAISKSMSDTLDAENKRRDDKKQAIDDASRKYVNELQNQPQTESADLNTRLGQFANDAASMSKMLLDDLKAGRISLKDYTIRTQNLSDDTKVALDLVQVYGERYKTVMEGINSGKLSAANGDLMAQFEGFTDLKNNKLYVDPTSGRVYAADEVIGPDGVKTMGKNIRNVSALKQTMQQDILRFNADNELNTRVDKLGGFITESLKSGGLYQIGAEIKFEDATKQQYYDKYKKDLTEELVGGPNNPRAISFFVDNMRISPSGKPYRMVSKKEDIKGPEDILIQQNANGQNMPVLTEQQMKDAEEWIKIQMRQKIKQSTEKQAFTIPQRPQPSGEGSGNKKEDDVMTYIMQLAFGTPAEKKTALDNINGLESEKGGTDRYEFSPDGKSLIKLKGGNRSDTEVLPIEQGMTREQWAARTSTVHGIADVNKVLKRNRVYFGQPVRFAENIQSSVRSIPAKAQLTTYLNTKAPSIKQTGSDADEGAAATSIGEIVANLGYTVKGVGRLSDIIRISKGGSDSNAVEISVEGINTDAGVREIMRQINNFIAGSSDENELGSFQKQGFLGSASGGSRNGELDE